MSSLSRDIYSDRLKGNIIIKYNICVEATNVIIDHKLNVMKPLNVIQIGKKIY